MKKRWIYSTVGAVSAGALAYALTDDNRRTKLKDGAKAVTQKVKSSRSNNHFPVEESGLPEQQDLENSKMVDEGSQFGVQYYNHVTDQEAEEMTKHNT
ncbi:hypothetical protein N781_12965 [Pontibacillus halophilus JSM 076056 = DSM 19796]|uniref:Uncharacterized protein n=1 Tax=Pontibacillus halophilus JSM 076056 = DSM 19796 TaxID=1385510 RepID=A0A0A5GQ57_9BACI|nr:hypothetical protein [Pontibacillus halophilus]KGX93310.1 hypothetical protein N781_12965 [Pontibacillus halophilus JSM 076056 = DSM 19796]